MSICLIDGNAIGYAAHGTRPLKVEGVGEVQAVFQSLKMLKRTKERFPEHPQLLWLWDGKAQFRYDAYPEYKGNRRDTPEKVEMKEKYHAVQPYLEDCLKALGVSQVLAPDYEADDLAGYFVRQADLKKRKVQLVTGDGDWMQLVSPTVSWYDPRTTADKFVSFATFEKQTGFSSVGKFLMHKALMGDSSDNISSTGIGDKGAALLINHFGGVKQMLGAYAANGAFNKENLPGDEFKFHRSKFNKFCAENGLALFKRNYKLMNLHSAAYDADMRSNAQITRSELDINEFEYLCRSLRFMSIVRELDRWVEAFTHKRGKAA